MVLTNVTAPKLARRVNPNAESSVERPKDEVGVVWMRQTHNVSPLHDLSSALCLGVARVSSQTSCRSAGKFRSGEISDLCWQQGVWSPVDQ